MRLLPKWDSLFFAPCSMQLRVNILQFRHHESRSGVTISKLISGGLLCSPKQVSPAEDETFSVFQTGTLFQDLCLYLLRFAAISSQPPVSLSFRWPIRGNRPGVNPVPGTSPAMSIVLRNRLQHWFHGNWRKLKPYFFGSLLKMFRRNIQRNIANDRMECI